MNSQVLGGDSVERLSSIITLYIYNYIFAYINTYVAIGL